MTLSTIIHGGLLKGFGVLGGLALLLGLGTLPLESVAQTFRVRTQEAGLGAVSSTNGVAIADYDRDGDLDVYFVVKASYEADDPATWNRLYKNDGDGTFSHVTSVPELTGHDVTQDLNSPMGHKLGASWGDYDNDGWPDLFLTHLGPNQLFHNDGDGTFTEVTEQAGVAGGDTQVSTSALWFDYDADGDLDLYVGNWNDYALENKDRDNWLYENNGDGTFTDVSDASGLADQEATWTTVALDVNDDGWLDVYLANDFGPNRLYVNQGDGTFQERTADFGVEDEYHGMGLAVADCDGNGFFDIYLTNITESGFDEEINPLFLNTGDDFFVNSSEDLGVALAGWGWGTEFFDLENDGDEDLFVATGYFEPDYENVLFQSRTETGALSFTDVAQAAGVDHDAAARGMVVFDYDRDGDQDVLVSNVSAAPLLYENRTEQGNWLAIELEGTQSNRDAFGAVVEVWTGATSVKKYHHGAQYLAQNVLPVHVGLGTAQAADRIQVRWPSGHVDEVEAVVANQRIRVRETEGLVDGEPVSTEDRPPVPASLRLLEVYPNPFSHSTQIRFTVGAPGDVELVVFNALGQTVQVVRRAFSSAGEVSITWNAETTSGTPLRSGAYFYRLRIDGRWAPHATGTLIYVRD